FSRDWSSDVCSSDLYIVSNEAAERFSYYGMKAILVVFMTEHLRNSAGQLAPMANAEAREYYHWFSSSVYFFPLIGALVADAFLEIGRASGRDREQIE